MQILITTGMAVLFWFFNICYLQHHKNEKLQAITFLGKGKLLILAGYILMAVGMGWLYKLYGFSNMMTAEYIGIVYIMILIAYIDKKEWRIPNNLLFGLGIFCIVCMMVMVCLKEVEPQELLWHCLFGVVMGGGTFFAGYLFSKGSLGLGDVKLMAVLGFILGDNLILVCMLFSLVLSAMAGIFGIIRKKKTMKDAVAFAPFVTTALLILFILGI